MKIQARKWLAASGLLAASTALFIATVVPGGGATQAAAPTQGTGAGAGAKAPLSQVHPVRRENMPPVVNGPAPLTGPASSFKPLDDPNWGPNVRANTDSQSPNRAQQEPSIAVNPLNPLNIVASAKDERAGANTKQDWIYTSTDGGQTWINQQFPLRAPASPFSSDPVVKFSDDGICYVTALPYGGGAAGIQVSASTDGGITFGPATQVTNNGGADKEWTWIDNFPSSPYYHRIYVAWMDFSPGFRVTYSTDRGQTWTQSALAQSAFQFPMPIVYPNGDVMVTYYGGSGVSAIRSTNGGVNWSGAQTISSLTDPSCPPDDGGASCSIWRMNAIPVIAVDPTNGDAVAMWADGRSGASLIYYSRSTNNGATWSAAQQLAPPGVANTYQVEPWVEADEQGILHSIWYDDRENPNTSIFHIYYSQSTDDGATWSTAVRITEASSDLRIGIPSSYAGAAGDYINVTASHGNVYGTWTDTRSGTGEDVYVVRGIYGAGGTPTNTPTGTPPTATSTRTHTLTPSPTPTTCSNYTWITGTATIVPGTTDTGNHGDDEVTTVTLPFPVLLFGSSYNTVNVSSNGNAQFVSSDTEYQNDCLPYTSFGPTIFPHWDDQRTDAQSGCSAFTSGCGIFTSVSGSAPNRIFNIEWRAVYYSDPTAAVNYEVRLYENRDNFDLIYGAVPQGGSSATVGVQSDAGALYAQFECNTGGLTAGMALYFTLPPCGSATVTPTTPASTVTTTSTATSTATTGTGTPETTSTSTVEPGSPTVTTTPCTINFSDVHTTDYFYEDVRCVYCLGAVSGYADGTFRPFNNTTRGQMTKIIVLALHIPIATPSGTPTFNDVAPGSAFYDYVETAAGAGIVSGYADGSFRPNADVTRGQLSKIDVVAANHMFNWEILNPATPTFSDVAPGSAFYEYIETAVCHGIISGYADGTFRPGNNAIRAQIAKIVCRTSQNPADTCNPTATPVR